MIELVLQPQHASQLRLAIEETNRETCIVFLTRPAGLDGDERLLSVEALAPSQKDYAERDLLVAVLRPTFVAQVCKRARDEGLGLVFAHTHPAASNPQFSRMDDEGEQHLSSLLTRRGVQGLHLALVIGTEHVTARVLGTDEEVKVIALGESRRVLSQDEESESSGLSDRFDRQVRAFGASSQLILRKLRIGVVGLGGTGSLICQQLVHLGISHFLLLDPDFVDATSLNRLANARVADVGQSKVEVASRYIHSVDERAEVKAVIGDVMKARFARMLADLDFVFGCTDSHGSRSVIQQIAYQYFVPTIDMGVTIVVQNESVTHMQGRVQLLAPGMACLSCSGMLDPQEVRRDMMTAFERQSDPYIIGAQEPAPAVMSLNGAVSSLATTMFLSIAAGLPSPARHIHYNAMTPALRAVHIPARPNCFICSRDGVLGKGMHRELMARLD